MSEAPPQSVTPPVVIGCGPARSSRGRRLWGAAVAAGSGGLLTVAALLQPAGAGIGTHEQLGLPPCGWILAMDLPCPTCGMTTAFSHAADGNLLASAITQPFGCLLAIATAMALMVGGYVAVTGSRIASVLPRLFDRRVVWLLIGLFVAAWAYKVVSHRF